MEVIVLSIHLLVCVCLIGLVLLQRSEGGALGMGGGGGGGGSLMSGRGAADALARMTSVAGGFFLVTSLGLTVLSGTSANAGSSVLDSIVPQSSAPATIPAAPTITTPAEPTETRPDPTESSIPATTQLAAASQPAAAPPSSTAQRAGPLTGTPAAATPASRPTQTAAVTTPPRQPAATTQRSTSTTTQATTPATTAPALVLPNSSGGVSGIALEDAASEAESSEAGDRLEAVRREQRAGPDQ